ncbi:hypothetical protein L291_2488 [Acinetobacter guillouiae MSP4-18]|nr:hypothetical protein L291_2488 [Acinetobacter guillouiae MSP4-18]
MSEQYALVKAWKFFNKSNKSLTFPSNFFNFHFFIKHDRHAVLIQMQGKIYPR